MIKVSIIMPVYNAEKMIKNAIDSILKQTFKSWELLLIDDGSKDNSPQICDEYSLKDSRIKVFHKKNNEGVAMARQTGINNAIGEYSIHVDADDWIEPTMLEELYNTAQNNNSDIVIADYIINTNNTQRFIKQKPASLQPENILIDIFDNKLFGALWNKLIRTDLFTRYNIKFIPNINHCEDVLFLVQLLQNKKITISYFPKAFYHYQINNFSITQNFTYNTYKTRLEFRNKLKELLVLPQKDLIINKVSFGIFTEAFIHRVLTKDEIKKGINRYRNQIKHIKSLKWRLGFYLLKWGFYSFAHKFIHY
jgi:glycosyltransferase involved in cell wall biosynthesis